MLLHNKEDRVYVITIVISIIWYFLSVGIFTGIYFDIFARTHNITTGCQLDPPSCIIEDRMRCYKNGMGFCFYIGAMILLISWGIFAFGVIFYVLSNRSVGSGSS